jgi:hypothetical protein
MHSAEVHATLVEQPRGAAETHLNCDVEGCDAKIASGQLMGGHLPHELVISTCVTRVRTPTVAVAAAGLDAPLQPTPGPRSAVSSLARARAEASRRRRDLDDPGGCHVARARACGVLFPAARTPGKSRGDRCLARPRIKFTCDAYTTPPPAPPRPPPNIDAHTDTRPGALRTGLHSSPPYIP